MFKNEYQKLVEEVKEKTGEINRLYRTIDTEKHNHALEIEKMKAEHTLALREKDFDMKHFKDEEIQKIQGKLTEAEKTLAVLEKENKMLDRITDLNADLIDIKSLVNKLIEKLPSINLTSLTVSESNKK